MSIFVKEVERDNQIKLIFSYKQQGKNEKYISKALKKSGQLNTENGSPWTAGEITHLVRKYGQQAVEAGLVDQAKLATPKNTTSKAIKGGFPFITIGVICSFLAIALVATGIDMSFITGLGMLVLSVILIICGGGGPGVAILWIPIAVILIFSRNTELGWLGFIMLFLVVGMFFSGGSGGGGGGNRDKYGSSSDRYD